MLFAGLLKKPITVVFKEEGNDRVVATWRVPLDKLPQSFVADTRLQMGGQHYLVVSANPSTRRLAAEARQLTIVIRSAQAPSSSES
ncbi:MAG TPA: hypothetical protein VH560_15190 [Polyangia bacterium]|jgi:hypothetical protein|nr:hypothetical protein [Polyangia bacterium]